MASLHRTSKTRNGKRVVFAKWRGSYKDEHGRWRTVSLFTDKEASRTRLYELQRQADLRRAGVITPVMDHAAKPIAEHVEDYVADLTHQRRVTMHVHNVRTRLSEVVALAGWTRLSEIDADGMAAVLRTLAGRGVTGSRDKGLKLATSTVNSFLKVTRAFVAWLIQRGRLVHDPLKGLDYADESRADRRRARRALTMDEIGALLRTAPPHRSLVYRFLMLTGLRRSEARFLLVGDLHLDAPQPFIRLRPKTTKNARPDPVPLHPDLVGPLRRLTRGRPAGSRVFAAIPEVRTLERDLKKAGVAFVDELGRRADVHAHRHTYGTLVVLSGARPGEAQQLMRHADPRLTMGVYSHVGLLPTATALARVQLPAAVADADDAAGGENGLENVAKTADGSGPPASADVASEGVELVADDPAASARFLESYGRIVLSGPQASLLDLLLRETPATVEKTGPRSSVG